MTTPQHTRPFNLEHARAGAPFSGQYGEAVRILLWDRKHPTHPILAIEEHGEQEAIAFRADGIATHDNIALSSRLVMIPLGFIDGKPVFVGDSIIVDGTSKWEAKPSDREFTGCTWPAHAVKYPETRLHHRDVANMFGKNEHWHAATVTAVANAALRHAVVGGYLVLPAIHDALQHELNLLKRGNSGGNTITAGAGTAPATKYPETTMADPELLLAADGCASRLLSAQLRHMVNVGLRHAIDEGLVVLPGKEMDDGDIFEALRKAERKHGVAVINDLVVRDTVRSLMVTEPQVDQLKADLARTSRELGQAERLLESLGWRSAGNGQWLAPDAGDAHVRAARDMAIAEAVRSEMQSRFAARGDTTMKAAYAANQIAAFDLSAIIAGVKP